MARDPDGKPIETRGRRSISQRTRDLTEQLKGVGELFDGSPRILEAAFTGVFFGTFVYFLRPRLIVNYTSDTAKPKFRGRFVDSITIDHPDLPMGENLSVLTALIVAPNIGGDVGSLLVPVASAGIFKKFMELTFPQNENVPYQQIFTDMGFNSENLPGTGPLAPDATAFIYTHYVLPRYLRALFVASFFYIVLRYIRHLGNK